METKESKFLTKKHILLCIDDGIDEADIDNKVISKKFHSELSSLKKDFCGVVVDNFTDLLKQDTKDDTFIYFCGNVKLHIDKLLKVKCQTIVVIKEYSENYDTTSRSMDYEVLSADNAPLNICNAGVYFKEFFGIDKKYFEMLTKKHKFQKLTESTKPSDAFREAIYMTKVTETDDGLQFKLLRCSSNLAGPTENFSETDDEIVNSVNRVSKHFFENSADLDHVLAQVYKNTVKENNGIVTEKKAKIKAHSDKTKDMPENGLIAFCTFYDNNQTDGKQYKDDALTKLRFRLKEPKDSNEAIQFSDMVKKFDVVLHPNSVFIISLTTNRLYTHEIVPSSKQIKDIPTRMGYVIRCSKTTGIFSNGKTYIVEDDNKKVQLIEADDAGVKKLKDFYYQENMTTDVINYDKFYFSLNRGDYIQPNL